MVSVGIGGEGVALGESGAGQKALGGQHHKAVSCTEEAPGLREQHYNPCHFLLSRVGPCPSEQSSVASTILALTHLWGCD